MLRQLAAQSPLWLLIYFQDDKQAVHPVPLVHVEHELWQVMQTPPLKYFPVSAQAVHSVPLVHVEHELWQVMQTPETS